MSRSLVVFAISFQFIFAVCFAGDKIRLKNETFSITEKTNANGFNRAGPRFLPTQGKEFYIVQFSGPVLKTWKDNLEKAGVKFATYIPDDAFLAKIQNSESWAALNVATNIKGIMPYETKYRISQEFGSDLNSKKPQQVLVRLISDTEFENFIKQSRNLNISNISRASDRLVGLTIADSIHKLAEIEGVEWIEPYKKMQIFDFDVSSNLHNQETPNGDYTDLTGYESGTKLMNFSAAHARGFNGQSEIVAVADTGLDRGSTTEILEDLKGQVIKGYALGFFGLNFRNLVKWSDPQGHGTHVAGSVLGSGVSSNGMLKGGAFGAKLAFEGMWNTLLNNLLVLPNFEKLFGHVHTTDDVHVHSNSWGTVANLGAYDNFAAMIDDIAWKYPEFLVVFAAGNSGQDLNRDGKIDGGSVSSPGTAKNVLTVGASKNLVPVGGMQKMMKELRGGTQKWGVDPIATSKLSETEIGMAAFSSTGPTLDGRIKPDIVAPGTNIISTQSQHPKATKLWGPYNAIYSYAGGTSMSTPLTSGAAAVTRQYIRAQGLHKPSAALVKAVLIHTAFDLFPGQYGTGRFQEFTVRRPNMNEGFGRVDMDKATTIKKENLIDDKNGVPTGGSQNYELEVKVGQKVRVTMVYTDAPASAGAAEALVNNLDLKVMDYEGNSFFPNHLSTTDTKNNTEMVEFTAPHDGTYNISVRGTSVPQGRPGTGTQPYALVVTSLNE